MLAQRALSVGCELGSDIITSASCAPSPQFLGDIHRARYSLRNIPFESGIKLLCKDNLVSRSFILVLVLIFVVAVRVPDNILL